MINFVSDELLRPCRLQLVLRSGQLPDGWALGQSSALVGRGRAERALSSLLDASEHAPRSCAYVFVV